MTMELTSAATAPSARSRPFPERVGAREEKLLELVDDLARERMRDKRTIEKLEAMVEHLADKLKRRSAA